MPVPIISPAGPLTKDGKTLTNFTADQAVTWATTGGLLSNITSTSVTWEAPNKTGLWQLSGDNGPDAPGIVNITVRALLPVLWSMGNPITAHKEILYWRPTEGPSQSRTFGSGKHIRDWELSNDDNSYLEFLEIKDFHLFHFPGMVFDLYDPILEERRTYEIDSDMNYHYNTADSYAWSFRIKEAYPYALVGA